MSDLAAPVQRPDVPTAQPTEARSYALAGLLYLGVRACGVAILAILAWYHERSLVDLLHVWDGEWYLAIAEHGYSGDLPDSLVDAEGRQTNVTPLAFFPALPTMTRMLTSVTSMDFLASALIINVFAGLAAAFALLRIGRSLDGRDRVGMLLVALWAGAPMAITLSMAYTEALFTALAAWALVGVLERRWWLAALCCVGAGLVRPTASVLIAVVGLAALVAVYQSRHRWYALACAVVCPLGLLGYWGYVASRTGSLTGWFDIEEEGWSTSFDGGRETAEFVGGVLAEAPSVMEVGTVAILLGAVVLSVLAAVNRVPWPLVLYAIGVVVLVAGSAGLPFVKARFLLPGFALLIPIALGLSNRRTATAVTATSGLVLLGCWFSAYALTSWEFAI